MFYHEADATIVAVFDTVLWVIFSWVKYIYYYMCVQKTYSDNDGL